jgi:hypothetical protein
MAKRFITENSMKEKVAGQLATMSFIYNLIN